MKHLNFKKHLQINEALAIELHGLWQDSYPIEAELIGVDLKDFPPLSRKVIDFETCKNRFLVLRSTNELRACLEIKELDNGFRFQSFLVASKHLRKGYGSTLMQEGLNLYKSPIFIETGALNSPAISLYNKYGFQVYGVYRSHGILKVKMKLS
ncbi:GNAT family N-acetyltransferase [Flavobacteriaceae bacterium]|nr:GNAT family N-acetyltransferase [Flavobacteriaceae bacterium]